MNSNQTIVMIMYPLLGGKRPSENLIKAMDFAHGQHAHAQLHLQSWSPWALATQEADAAGASGSAGSDFTAFVCPALCLLTFWGCAGLGKTWPMCSSRSRR